MHYLPAIAGLVAMLGVALAAVGVWLAGGGAQVDHLTEDVRHPSLTDTEWKDHR